MGALLLAVMLTAGTPVDDAIYQASVEFGVPHADLADLAFCESSHDPMAVGDGGAAVGLFQFHERTWYANARHLGYRDDLRSDPTAASRVAAWKIAREGYWAWANCANSR